MCAFDGTKCTHTHTYLMTFAGAPQGSAAFGAAHECTGAVTRDGCAAVGGRVAVSAAALREVQAGNFTAALESASKVPASGAGGWGAPGAAVAAAVAVAVGALLVL